MASNSSDQADSVMEPPTKRYLRIAQADSYAGHARRADLMGRVEAMLKRYYPAEQDPYRLYEKQIAHYLRRKHMLLDAGCGRLAPVLHLFREQVEKAIGVDLVQFSPELADSGLLLLNCELTAIPLASASLDLIISRSVVEHLADPACAYAEFHRLLKPGGRLIFITPNVWSYPMVASRIIPNRFHAAVVDWAEGRPKDDTFETYYRSNSFRAIRRLAAGTAFEVTSLSWLTMFPNYLMFHPWAFRAGIAYERLVSRVRPLNFLQHWILAVLTKPVQ